MPNSRVKETKPRLPYPSTTNEGQVESDRPFATVRTTLDDLEMEKLEVAGEVAEEKTILARRTKDFGFLPIPHRLQWDPTKPPKFGLGMNLVFAFACAFSVVSPGV